MHQAPRKNEYLTKDSAKAPSRSSSKLSRDLREGWTHERARFTGMSTTPQGYPPAAFRFR